MTPFAPTPKYPCFPQVPPFVASRLVRPDLHTKKPHSRTHCYHGLEQADPFKRQHEQLSEKEGKMSNMLRERTKLIEEWG